MTSTMNTGSFKSISVAELDTMLRQSSLRLVDVRARHGEAEPSGAGVPASHLLPQSAGSISNVSEVRTDAESAREKIPQGEPLPLHLMQMRLNEMDKNATTVFYCQMGGRSAQASAFAAGNGFADAYNLQGGIAAWERAGLSVSA